MPNLRTYALQIVAFALAFFVMSGMAGAQDAVRLDDFTRTYPPGEAYGRWSLQKIAPLFGSGKDQFFQFVHKSDAEHYVHLRSGPNNSFSLGTEDEFRVQDWPVLTWEWRVVRTPKDGDVRRKNLDDQAGSICVIVDPGLVGFDSLCYLWENDGPKDEPLTSSKRDRSRYLILRTVAADGIDKWYSESRNMLADYERVFGKKPDKGAVIGMQIDSDSTESGAEVFYRNIFRRKK